MILGIIALIVALLALALNIRKPEQDVKDVALELEDVKTQLAKARIQLIDLYKIIEKNSQILRNSEK